MMRIDRANVLSDEERRFLTAFYADEQRRGTLSLANAVDLRAALRRIGIVVEAPMLKVLFRRHYDPTGGRARDGDSTVQSPAGSRPTSSPMRRVDGVIDRTDSNAALTAMSRSSLRSRFDWGAAHQREPTKKATPKRDQHPRGPLELHPSSLFHTCEGGGRMSCSAFIDLCTDLKEMHLTERRHRRRHCLKRFATGVTKGEDTLISKGEDDGTDSDDLAVEDAVEELRSLQPPPIRDAARSRLALLQRTRKNLRYSFLGSQALETTSPSDIQSQTNMTSQASIAAFVSALTGSAGASGPDGLGEVPVSRDDAQRLARYLPYVHDMRDIATRLEPRDSDESEGSSSHADLSEFSDSSISSDPGGDALYLEGSGLYALAVERCRVHAERRRCRDEDRAGRKSAKSAVVSTSKEGTAAPNTVNRRVVRMFAVEQVLRRCIPGPFPSEPPVQRLDGVAGAVLESPREAQVADPDGLLADPFLYVKLDEGDVAQLLGKKHQSSPPAHTGENKRERASEPHVRVALAATEVERRRLLAEELSRSESSAAVIVRLQRELRDEALLLRALLYDAAPSEVDLSEIDAVRLTRVAKEQRAARRTLQRMRSRRGSNMNLDGQVPSEADMSQVGSVDAALAANLVPGGRGKATITESHALLLSDEDLQVMERKAAIQERLFMSPQKNRALTQLLKNETKAAEEADESAQAARLLMRKKSSLQGGRKSQGRRTSMQRLMGESSTSPMGSIGERRGSTLSESSDRVALQSGKHNNHTFLTPGELAALRRLSDDRARSKYPAYEKLRDAVARYVDRQGQLEVMAGLNVGGAESELPVAGFGGDAPPLDVHSPSKVASPQRFTNPQQRLPSPGGLIVCDPSTSIRTAQNSLLSPTPSHAVLSHRSLAQHQLAELESSSRLSAPSTRTTGAWQDPVDADTTLMLSFSAASPLNNSVATPKAAGVGRVYSPTNGGSTPLSSSHRLHELQMQQPALERYQNITDGNRDHASLLNAVDTSQRKLPKTFAQNQERWEAILSQERSRFDADEEQRSNRRVQTKRLEAAFEECDMPYETFIYTPQLKRRPEMPIFFPKSFIDITSRPTSAPLVSHSHAMRTHALLAKKRRYLTKSAAMDLRKGPLLGNGRTLFGHSFLDCPSPQWERPESETSESDTAHECNQRVQPAPIQSYPIRATAEPTHLSVPMKRTVSASADRSAPQPVCRGSGDLLVPMVREPAMEIRLFGRTDPATNFQSVQAQRGNPATPSLKAAAGAWSAAASQRLRAEKTRRRSNSASWTSSTVQDKPPPLSPSAHGYSICGAVPSRPHLVNEQQEAPLPRTLVDRSNNVNKSNSVGWSHRIAVPKAELSHQVKDLVDSFLEDCRKQEAAEADVTRRHNIRHNRRSKK